jgi:hypothetical protein
LTDVLTLLEMELEAEGGVVSCLLCRRRIRDYKRLKQHLTAEHVFVREKRKKHYKKAMHIAADGAKVCALRECVKADGTAKLRYPSKADADRAAMVLDGRYHGYGCSSGHFHVGRRSG